MVGIQSLGKGGELGASTGGWGPSPISYLSFLNPVSAQTYTYGQWAQMRFSVPHTVPPNVKEVSRGQGEGKRLSMCLPWHLILAAV